MIQALKLLQDELPHHQPLHPHHRRPIPTYSLVSQLLTSLKDYSHHSQKLKQSKAESSNSEPAVYWAQYLRNIKKPPSLAHLIESWQMQSVHSLQLQLLSTFLGSSDRRKIQLYLRMRKYLGQLFSCQNFDELALLHEDAITVIHRMFPVEVRKEIMRGVKQIFITFRATTAKIYACVFIEYILSVYDSVGDEEQSVMAGEAKTTSRIHLSDISSIANFSSNLHKHQQPTPNQQPLPQKVQDQNYLILQTKFLPQQLQRKKAYLAQQENSSYYYSNSLNFNEQNSFEDISSKCKQLVELRSGQADKENHYQQKSKNGHQRRQNIEIQKQVHGEILIEEPATERQSKVSGQHMCSSGSSEHSNKNIQSLVERNRSFKERILSVVGSKAKLHYEQEQTIKDAINIIHNSVVRNHRYK